MELTAAQPVVDVDDQLLPETEEVTPHGLPEWPAAPWKPVNSNGSNQRYNHPGRRYP